jgi:hypothetical protein|tara:strand:- start:5506 stop:5799 length:294 start_codon:yes stop_codon:yes gene_type:complete
VDSSKETKEFHLPLEMQFAMRKAEVHAKELDREELIVALLNLYHQRLMEWNALKALMAEEQVDIEFDIPTDIELTELIGQFGDLMDEYDDDEGFSAV